MVTTVNLTLSMREVGWHNPPMHANPSQLSAVQTAPQGSISSESWIALALLTAAYTLSFIDRTAVSVVQEQIKAEMLLSDWQIGLMIGPAFAIIYSLAGLPLARLAERSHRARLLAGCIAVWSAMTMLFGQGRSFISLFVARMGVGIGEAGGNPTSHALIAEHFPEARRSMAIAIFSLGAPLGSFLGAAGTGWLADQIGWRNTFLVLGIPGFVLAVIMLIWLKDPERTWRAGVASRKQEPIPSLQLVAGELVRNSAFRHLAWGGALVVLVGYCLPAFLPALLVRSYGLPLAQVGLFTGLVSGLGGGVGTIIGGIAGDRWAKGQPVRLAIVSALAIVPAPIFIAGGILSNNLYLAVAGCMLGTASLYAFVAPTFAQVHALASGRNRATVTSIFYLVTNLVGFGLGPPIVGALSDFWSRRALGLDAEAFAVTCLSSAARRSDCNMAMADGMEMALLAMCLLPLVASCHFLMVARRQSQQGVPLEVAQPVNDVAMTDQNRED